MAETSIPSDTTDSGGRAPTGSVKPASPKNSTLPTRRRASRKAAPPSAPKATSKPRAAVKPNDPIGSLLDSVEGVVPAAAIAKPAKAAARTVNRRAATARPVVDSVKPVARTIKTRARSATSVMRHSATNARQRVEAGAAAVSRTASGAIDAAAKRAGRAAAATKTAATSRTAVVLAAAAAGLVTGLAVNLGRKAAVQAPSVMAGDWLEAVKLEHKAALALFDAIEETSDTEPAKRTILLIQLTHALAKHAFTEENVIYPALREWGDKADADKLNHDHGYVKQHLYDLDAIDPASAGFLPKIATFRADLEAHIAEEERSIFPPLHAGLDESQNAKITALANKEGFKLA